MVYLYPGAGSTASFPNGGDGQGYSNGGIGGTQEDSTGLPSTNNGADSPPTDAKGEGTAVFSRLSVPTTNYEYPQGGKGGHGMIIIEWR